MFAVTSTLFVLLTSLAQFSWQYADFYALNKTCHQTWNLFEVSFNLSELSRIDFIQGNQLDICDGPDMICCNRMLEKNLSLLSIKQYRRAFLSNNLLPIKTNLINYAYNFDNLIEEILEISRMEFDHEFNKTYSSARHHVDDFDFFYASLKNYYSEYEVNLRDIVKRLFASVIRMIVTTATTGGTSLTNMATTDSSSSSSSSAAAAIATSTTKLHQRCLATSADSDLLIDSDARMHLESRLECALESARLFSAALTRLRDLVIELYAKFESQAAPSRLACLRELTRTYTCSMCLSDRHVGVAKKRALRPCFKTCLDTYRTCIDLDFNKLDPVWNLYISKSSLV